MEGGKHREGSSDNLWDGWVQGESAMGGGPGKGGRISRRGVLLLLIGAPAGVAKEGEEVGEFLTGELFVQAGGHGAEGGGLEVSDLFAGDAGFGAWTGGEDDFGGGVASEDSGDVVAVGGGDGPGFIGADEGGGGEDDGFEQVAIGANGADGGEVGAEVAAKITDAMTRGTGGAFAVEEGLAAADIAGVGEEFGQELVKATLVGGGVGAAGVQPGGGGGGQGGRIVGEGGEDVFGAEGAGGGGLLEGLEQGVAEFGVLTAGEGGEESGQFDGAGGGEGGEELLAVGIEEAEAAGGLGGV